MSGTGEAVVTPGVHDVDQPDKVSLPRALFGLSKPRVTSEVIFTTLGGFYLAPGSPSLLQAITVLTGTVMVVAAANTLNMYLERDSDARMVRTRKRPLPSGSITPSAALLFGLVLAAAALPLLALRVNWLTAGLGALALVAYVAIYTPLKRHSSVALVVGAVPGAIPPVMGWTAATGRLDLPGVLLFAVLFLWQIPHFLAIAIYNSEDYARGRIRVMPLVEGLGAAKRQIVIWQAALLPTSLLLVPAGVAGPAYLAVALVGGLVFFGWGVYGLRESAGAAWARSLFRVSLVYLTALFLALGIEGRMHG